MKCEGADNPPCRRCRNTGLECLFEKPSREQTLTGEAGLERIRALESHVMEIRHGQASIQAMLADIQAQLRGASAPARSPSAYAQSYHQSPSLHSPSIPTPPGPHSQDMQTPPAPGPHFPQASRQSRPLSNQPTYPSASLSQAQVSPTAEYHPPQLPPPSTNYSYNSSSSFSNQQGHVLPPFSSLQAMSSQSGNLSSVRFSGESAQQQPRSIRPLSQPVTQQQSSTSKRIPSSNVTSADSSGPEDDDDGLPASGLVAPWEVLRGLADVAIEQAAKENGDSSEPHSRPRTPTPERQGRPTKRRKIRHRVPRPLTFPDVVTKNIISEAEARELFRIFYHGCSTFLPVFDSTSDTYDALHERSPFAVDSICLVAARVRDGGAKPSDIHKNCLEEVQAISCATLFSPVMRVEAVQSMILVSGWSDNGWLSGGHAVRMAMELSLHRAWPKLLKRMNNHDVDVNADRELVIGSRTWFCLYLFEHQLSYGTGRPAILKDDESIRHCRLFLQHPLSIEDDMRLVSTVELMALRERVHNAISPSEDSIRDQDFEELHRADIAFRNWYATWDQAFSQKYEDAAFYRQSLQIQHLHAELFHNAIALRGINGPDDVQKMPPPQRDVAIKSIQIGRQALDITVNSPAYREGLKYAVHYTHATATFAASFLLRLARLFPNECDLDEIRSQVEHLASVMADLPGKRYALTLQVMLKRFRKRKSTSSSRSPKASRDRESHRPMPMVIEQPSIQYSPVYEHHPPQYSQEPIHVMSIAPTQALGQHFYGPFDAENIWRGFEMTSNEQLPVWISDQTLGGNSFSQHGMDAFLMPTDYLPPAPQIW